jgi:hypothetical protein
MIDTEQALKRSIQDHLGVKIDSQLSAGIYNGSWLGKVNFPRHEEKFLTLQREALVAKLVSIKVLTVEHRNLMRKELKYLNV